ncbi:MAG: EF-hand domain-containing protein [Cyclobacteriaceae bacterium]
MKYSETFFKRFATYALGVGIVVLTAACGSSSEEQASQTEMNEPEAVEQTTTAETNQPTVTPEQTEVEDVETKLVVNTKPAITRDSEEYKMMKELRERNRNNEVLAGITIKYGDWDADGDNALNENEFFEGFYRVWDRDNSNSINQDEFTTATENLFVNYEFSEYGQFSDWDADGNGEVSNQEFMNGMNQIIESDAGQESANRLITIWDLDNDDKIKRIELSNITVLLDADNN